MAVKATLLTCWSGVVVTIGTMTTVGSGVRVGFGVGGVSRGSAGGCHKTAAVGVGTTVEVGVGTGSGSGVSGEPSRQADTAASTSISTTPKPKRPTLSATVMVVLYQTPPNLGSTFNPHAPFFRAFAGCTPIYGAGILRKGDKYAHVS